MEGTRYNLRSNRRECSIPVQLQLATDEDFMMASRSHMESPQAGQVFSELSDSESDIDISDFIRSSDQNLSPISSDKQGALTGGGRDSAPSVSGSNFSTSDQAAINQKILQQLNALGQRLDSTEKNTLSNTGAKPKVRAQVKKAKCQHKTKTHVNAIPGKPKIKSQRGGSVEVFVPHRVKWPHEFILAGQNKDRVTYNQLSPIQWMAGFCRTIREESDMVTREHMLDYVINLLDDDTDFSWASAKASDAVLLCRMEQGEIAGWQDTEKVDRVRRAHAQRHVVGQGNTYKAQDKGSNGGKVFPCVYFNRGACLQKQTHDNKGVTYRHICSYCWNKEGKMFPHPQVECRKSQGNVKNDLQKNE